MIHFLLRVTLCIIAIFFVGCTSHQARLIPANDKPSCKMACERQLQRCNQVCHNNCMDCGNSADMNSAYDYNKYKNEQRVEGGVIARDLKSYRDPLQCDKITCDCRADFVVCNESCTGIIHKRLQIAPICC